MVLTNYTPLSEN